MTDISTDKFLFAAMNPLVRDGGLLAALPTKGTFEAHLRQAGARTDRPDIRPAATGHHPPGRQYSPADLSASQLPREPAAKPSARREEEPSGQSAPAAAAQPQTSQTAQSEQRLETDAHSHDPPQNAADPAAVSEGSLSHNSDQCSAASTPQTEDQPNQANGNQLAAPVEAPLAETPDEAATLSVAELSVAGLTAPADKRSQQQPAGDPALSDAAILPGGDGHPVEPAATDHQSAARPAAKGVSGAAGDLSVSPGEQAAVTAAVGVPEAIAEAAESSGNQRAGRSSQQSNSSTAEVRAAGDSIIPTVQGPASPRPDNPQMLQNLAATNAAALERAGEAAAVKSDSGFAARQGLASGQDFRSGHSGVQTPTSRSSSPAATSVEENADGLSMVDRVRFVQRVARAFEAIGARAGTLRLRLSPPELGTLRVEIAVRDGALSARLQAENQIVRNLLLDNLPALRERLAQQDIRVERFQVELFDQSQSNNWQQPAGQSDWQQPGRYRTPLADRGPLPSGKPVGLPANPRRLPSEGQLDVLV